MWLAVVDAPEDRLARTAYGDFARSATHSRGRNHSTISAPGGGAGGSKRVRSYGPYGKGVPVRSAHLGGPAVRLPPPFPLRKSDALATHASWSCSFSGALPFGLYARRSSRPPDSDVGWSCEFNGRPAPAHRPGGTTLPPHSLRGCGCRWAKSRQSRTRRTRHKMVPRRYKWGEVRLTFLPRTKY